MASDWRDKFHNIQFSFDDEVVIQEWYATNKPNYVTCLEELLDNGWSVKITPPSRGDAYWCSVTCKDAKSPYHEHTFSVKYPDLSAAVVLAFYVVEVMLERGEFSTLVQSNGNRWLG